MSAPAVVRFFAFVVAGEGDFPMDMLRHAACWPRSEEDARKLTERKYREIHLESWCRRAPTPGEVGADRWASFGWKVIRIGEAR